MKSVIIVFAALNVLLFSWQGYEVATVTVEQAAKEGMAQNIYASFLYIEIMIVISWLLIGWSACKARLEIFKATAWFYIGLMACDLVISHPMAVNMEDPAFTPSALVMFALQGGFLYWVGKKVDWVRG